MVGVLLIGIPEGFALLEGFVVPVRVGTPLLE